MYNNKKVVAYGIGNNFYSYLSRIEEYVDYIGDNNKKYLGKYIYKDIRYISNDEIEEIKNVLIVIMLDTEKFISDIEYQFRSMGVECVRVRDFLEEIEISADAMLNWIDNHSRGKIKRFIDLHLDRTNVCNFHCDYCSVWRSTGTGNQRVGCGRPVSELRSALSVKKLGGTCYINICARGETLLAEDIFEMVYQLLDEGHYVSVVTNGTICKVIKQIVSMPEALQKRMFFKLSFHYSELIEKRMMDVFWENVLLIQKSLCSYSIEITPSDRIIDKRDEILKLFEKYENGALPHITFTRDSTKEGLDLLSNRSLKEYTDIWSGYNSKLFDLKTRWYNKPIKEYCMAGAWSYIVEADTGRIRPCYGYGEIGNIYDDKEFPYEPVGCNCRKTYCFNNHVYMSLGCQPMIEDYSYAEMRDRCDNDGRRWLKEDISYRFNEKLYDNNFRDVNQWKDCLRLVNREKRRSIILLNSPDYPNLGDHAIAFSTCKLIEKYFPEYDFFEIPCDFYVKEKQLFSECILPEDVLMISGGGYVDSLHLKMLDITRDIVKSFENNKVIILPQTIFFENSSIGRAEKEAFKNNIIDNEKVTIFVREKASLETLNELSGEKNKNNYCYECDMALLLDVGDLLEGDCLNKDRKGVGLCFRNDREKVKERQEKIEQMMINRNVQFERFSTVINNSVFPSNRKAELKKLFELICSKELVVTDRLHCMILCFLTDTPCVAFDNTTGKIRGVYETLPKDARIILGNDNFDYEDALKDLYGDRLSVDVKSFVDLRQIEFEKRLRRIMD